MDKQQIIWLQRQREQDPETDAGARVRVNTAYQNMRPYVAQLNHLKHRMLKATTNSRKVRFLRDMADIVSRAFATVVPCKSGCSHCCNLPLLLTQEEADVIGQEVKRPAVRPARYSHKGNTAYTGTPCPFLKGDKCSIYRYRPYVCRLHVSVDKDDLLCNLASITQQPQWDSSAFHIAEVEAFYGKIDLMTEPHLADIREFFPEAPHGQG